MKTKIYQMLLLLLIFSSCKKLVEVGTPQNQLTTDKVYSDTLSAQAAMVNCYALFDKTIDPNYNKYLGLYTDELFYIGSSADLVEFNLSKLSATNGVVSNMWKNNYFAIYSANQIIEQLKSNSVIPQAMAKSLTAEAEFLRAYSYFYLVNTFGSVPLLLTTDVAQTTKTARTDSATIYNQIIADLKDAQINLSETYIGSGKVRANKWAATALLARIDLFQQNWVDAELQATSVINSGLYTPLNSPSVVFLANSKETILQFWTQNGFIADGASLIPSSGVPGYPISANLYAAFEAGDLRKANWLKTSVASGTTYYSPYKYHNRTTNTASPEYLTGLRISEQYLIRAEARAQQDNTNGAVQDLNIIRNRAGLSPLSLTLNKATCLTAIMQERRLELFMEWGNRFLDLRRTGRLSQVMSAYKTTWLPRAVSLPIPQSELTYDPFLTQNQGY